jgi:hypothetical protein
MRNLPKVATSKVVWAKPTGKVTLVKAKDAKPRELRRG